jgi:hypothetical protein
LSAQASRVPVIYFSAAGEARVQLGPEPAKPRKGEVGLGMAARPDRTEDQ